MKTGFTFKGKHSSTFDVTMRTTSRPIRPEVKSYTYETPLMDGSYDFSSANPYGREFYRNRIFTLSLLIHSDNIVELQKKISDISIWLCGKGDLIFDDLPAVKWQASVLNSIDYAPELSGHKAILTVSFEVSPFSEALFNTSDGPALASGITLDTLIPIDVPSAMTFNKNTFKVYNMGSWYIRPVITFSSETNTFNNLVIECNGKTLKVGGLSAYNINTLVFDMEKQTVTDGNGTNLMKYFSGEFFELKPGINEVTAAGNFSPFTVKVEYTPKFMYDFYTDWSDEDA